MTTLRLASPATTRQTALEAADRNGAALVVALDDPAAAEGDVTGERAARLARAARAGLPVRPGFVLTVEAVARIVRGRPWPDEVTRALWAGRQSLGPIPLLVSASTGDGPWGDPGDRVRVHPIDGMLALVVAVDQVLRSLGPARAGAAILVQPASATTAFGDLWDAQAGQDLADWPRRVPALAGCS